MLKIPSQILSLYDELLVKTAVPVRSHFLYKKWLREVDPIVKTKNHNI